MKTLLHYQLKQTSRQYMHKRRRFRTSKFTLMLSRLKFTSALKSDLKKKKKKKKIGKYFMGKKINGLFSN